MEKKQYDLFLEVLRRLYRAGLLNDVILIGSWATVFYKGYFKEFKRLKSYALVTRDLDFLVKDTICVKFEGIDVVLPHPARFAMHKLVVAQRRAKKDKAQKDNLVAVDILNDFVDAGEEELIRSVFKEFSLRWQKKIASALEGLDAAAISAVLESKG